MFVEWNKTLFNPLNKDFDYIDEGENFKGSLNLVTDTSNLYAGGWEQISTRQTID